jgi:hypothetical protein
LVFTVLRSRRVKETLGRRRAMTNARVSRVSAVGVTLSAGTVLACALGTMLTAGIAFADDAIDSSLDLPLEKPVPTIPAKKVTPPPPETPPPQDPADVTPPPQFFGHDLTAKNSIVYVIDQSGSMTLPVSAFTDMNGNVVAHGSRMDRAKSELEKSIASLSSNFKFNVYFYDECVRPWQGQDVLATEANKQAAFKFIDSQGPMGFTNTGLAVATALQDKTNHEVVLLSDGEPNFLDCNMQYVGSFADHRNMIKEANSQHAQIDCFGIGVSCDPNAREFMQEVASDNNGTYIECN